MPHSNAGKPRKSCQICTSDEVRMRDEKLSSGQFWGLRGNHWREQSHAEFLQEMLGVEEVLLGRTGQPGWGLSTGVGGVQILPLFYLDSLE